MTIKSDEIPLGWEARNNSIIKEYIQKDFKSIIEFINKIAAVAEEMDHHPNLFIHDYKKLTITLTTHNAGKVTEKDILLATKIDEINMEET